MWDSPTGPGPRFPGAFHHHHHHKLQAGGRRQSNPSYRKVRDPSPVSHKDESGPREKGRVSSNKIRQKADFKYTVYKPQQKLGASTWEENHLELARLRHTAHVHTEPVHPPPVPPAAGGPWTQGLAGLAREVSARAAAPSRALVRKHQSPGSNMRRNPGQDRALNRAEVLTLVVLSFTGTQTP